jgi:hypothetical protein
MANDDKITTIELLILAKRRCPRFISASEIESYVTTLIPDLFEHDCTGGQEH